MLELYTNLDEFKVFLEKNVGVAFGTISTRIGAAKRISKEAINKDIINIGFFDYSTYSDYKDSMESFLKSNYYLSIKNKRKGGGTDDNAVINDLISFYLLKFGLKDKDQDVIVRGYDKEIIADETVTKEFITGVNCVGIIDDSKSAKDSRVHLSVASKTVFEYEKKKNPFTINLHRFTYLIYLLNIKKLYESKYSASVNYDIWWKEFNDVLNSDEIWLSCKCHKEGPESKMYLYFDNATFFDNKRYLLFEKISNLRFCRYKNTKNEYFYTLEYIFNNKYFEAYKYLNLQ